MDYQRFPLFRELDEDQIERIVAACREAHLDAGTVFIEQGTRGRDIYFFTQGEMEVFIADGEGNEHQLAVITAPAVVGEVEFLTRDERAACVRTRRPSRALSLAFDRFLSRLEQGDPAFLRLFFNIAQVLARRLEAMNRKFAELDQRAPGARFHELKQFQQKLMNEWTF